jgi:hypothetical protein
MVRNLVLSAQEGAGRKNVIMPPLSREGGKVERRAKVMTVMRMTRVEGVRMERKSLAGREWSNRGRFRSPRTIHGIGCCIDISVCMYQ